MQWLYPTKEEEYGYSEQVDGSVLSAFIKHLKFTEALQDHPDLTNFIKKAVSLLI